MMFCSKNIKQILIVLLFLPHFFHALRPDTTFNKDGSYDISRGKWSWSYDSSGHLYMKEREETFLRKGYEVWYDTDGSKIEAGHFKVGKRHGKWKYYDSGKKEIKRFKFGLAEKVYNDAEDGRYRIYLTYGKGARRRYCNDVNVIFLPIAGCVVSAKKERVAWVHNKGVSLICFFRHGRKWRECRYI